MSVALRLDIQKDGRGDIYSYFLFDLRCLSRNCIAVMPIPRARYVQNSVISILEPVPLMELAVASRAEKHVAVAMLFDVAQPLPVPAASAHQARRSDVMSVGLMRTLRVFAAALQLQERALPAAGDVFAVITLFFRWHQIGPQCAHCSTLMSFVRSRKICCASPHRGQRGSLLHIDDLALAAGRVHVFQQHQRVLALAELVDDLPRQ